MREIRGGAQGRKGLEFGQMKVKPLEPTFAQVAVLAAKKCSTTTPTRGKSRARMGAWDPGGDGYKGLLHH